MSAGRAAARPLNAERVVEVAGRIVDAEGADALTMRRLSDELGVAVTSIYWHVGNRDELLAALVDELVASMGTIRARGADPRARIASLAHALRRRLLERPHRIGLAHALAKTPAVFEPARAAMAAELTTLGVEGEQADLALLSLQLHVVSSVLLARTLDRYGADEPVDQREVFDFTLHAVLDALTAPAS